MNDTTKFCEKISETKLEEKVLDDKIKKRTNPEERYHDSNNQHKVKKSKESKNKNSIEHRKSHQKFTIREARVSRENPDQTKLFTYVEDLKLTKKKKKEKKKESLLLNTKQSNEKHQR